MIWLPLEIDGESVPEGAGLMIQIGFDEKVGGWTGCNRFTGTAEKDAGELVLGPIAVTGMACLTPGKMKREAALPKALERAGFVASPRGLWLTRTGAGWARSDLLWANLTEAIAIALTFAFEPRKPFGTRGDQV